MKPPLPNNRHPTKLNSTSNISTVEGLRHSFDGSLHNQTQPNTNSTKAHSLSPYRGRNNVSDDEYESFDGSKLLARFRADKTSNNENDSSTPTTGLVTAMDLTSGVAKERFNRYAALKYS